MEETRTPLLDALLTRAEEVQKTHKEAMDRACEVVKTQLGVEVAAVTFERIRAAVHAFDAEMLALEAELAAGEKPEAGEPKAEKRKPGDVREQVLRFISDFSLVTAAGVPASVPAAALNLNPSSVASALAKLAKDGLIAKLGPGRYARKAAEAEAQKGGTA